MGTQTFFRGSTRRAGEARPTPAPRPKRGGKLVFVGGQLVGTARPGETAASALARLTVSRTDSQRVEVTSGEGRATLKTSPQFVAKLRAGISEEEAGLIGGEARDIQIPKKSFGVFRAAPEEDRLGKVRKFIREKTFELERKQTPLAGVGAIGLGVVREAVVEPSIFGKQLATQPVTTVKETAKIFTPTGLRRVKETVGTFGPRLKGGEVSLVGRATGAVLFAKGAPTVARVATGTAAKFAPGFQKVKFIGGLETTRPAELIAGKPRTDLFSVTQTRTTQLFPPKLKAPGGVLKVQERFFKEKGGAGSERKAFAKKFGTEESFLFFSPDVASLSFVKPVSVLKRLTTTGRFRLIKAQEAITSFKRPRQIAAAIGGRLTRTKKGILRAKLAKEVVERKQRIFPGTKGAAALGTEREAVLGTGGELFRQRGFIPAFTVDPFFRIVRILPGKLRKGDKIKRPKVPAKVRVKAIVESIKVKRIAEELTPTQRRVRGIAELRRRPAPSVSRRGVPTPRRTTIPAARRIAPPITKRKLTPTTRAIISPRPRAIPETRIVRTPTTRGITQAGRPLVPPPGKIVPPPAPIPKKLKLKKPKFQKFKLKVPIGTPRVSPSLAVALGEIKLKPVSLKKAERQIFAGVGPRPFVR